MKTNFFLKKSITIVFAGMLAVFMAGCSSKKSNVEWADAEVMEEALYEAPMAMDSMVAVNGSNAVARKSYATSGISSVEGAVYQPKKLIKNGNISLEVNDLTQAQKSVEEWVLSLGGYIESSYMDIRGMNWSVRIPAEKFDEAMEQCGTFGTLRSRNVYTNDVSDQYYDLESRLETRRIMKEKLEEYLKDAENITEILEIEQELNSVITEIESMEGRFNRLNAQVDYSTINVNVELPYGNTESGFETPSLMDGLRHFASSVVNFYGSYIIAILVILFCGVGVLAALAFFFWLLFGKVGIVIRLYNWLKR